MMGTRCDIYIENNDGTHIGAQCLFDGYPEHILKELEYCDYKMLKDYIVLAGSRGGFRLFYPTKGETEFAGGLPHYIYNPHSKNNDADYVYVVDKSNKINWKKRNAQSWKIQWHRKQQ